jgi:outer membrane protein
MRTQIPSPPRPTGEAEAGSKRHAVKAAAYAAIFSALLALVASLPAFAQNARVAYVDMQRLLDNAPQVVAAREGLQREFAQRDQSLKGDEAKLARLEADLKRDAAGLSRPESEGRQLEIDTLRRSIERTREKLRDELNTRIREELNKRWNDIHDVVVEYARERNLDLVVQSPVIYASAAVDITDAVIERLKREAAAPKLQ